MQETNLLSVCVWLKQLKHCTLTKNHRDWKLKLKSPNESKNRAVARWRLVTSMTHETQSVWFNSFLLSRVKITNKNWHELIESQACRITKLVNCKSNQEESTLFQPECVSSFNTEPLKLMKQRQEILKQTQRRRERTKTELKLRTSWNNLITKSINKEVWPL